MNKLAFPGCACLSGFILLLTQGCASVRIEGTFIGVLEPVTLVDWQQHVYQGVQMTVLSVTAKQANGAPPVHLVYDETDQRHALFVGADRKTPAAAGFSLLGKRVQVEGVEQVYRTREFAATGRHVLPVSETSIVPGSEPGRTFNREAFEEQKCRQILVQSVKEAPAP